MNQMRRPDASSGQSSAKLWRTNGQTIAELKGDIRLNTSVDRAKQLLSSVTSRVNAAKEQLEEAEKDVPKKTEAEKKVAETLAKANKDVEEKQASLTKAKEAKVKAEQVAVAAAAAVRDAQKSVDKTEQFNAESDQKAKVLQAQLVTYQQAVKEAPGNERLTALVSEVQTSLQNIQKTAPDRTKALSEVSKALKAASDQAGKAAAEIDKVQKPYNDSELAFEKTRREQNLASQQHALASSELKRATEILPLRKKEVETAENAQKTQQEKVSHLFLQTIRAHW